MRKHELVRLELPEVSQARRNVNVFVKQFHNITYSQDHGISQCRRGSHI
jgi:hypothetical protein